MFVTSHKFVMMICFASVASTPSLAIDAAASLQTAGKHSACSANVPTPRYFHAYIRRHYCQVALLDHSKVLQEVAWIPSC